MYSRWPDYEDVAAVVESMAKEGVEPDAITVRRMAVAAVKCDWKNGPMAGYRVLKRESEREGGKVDEQAPWTVAEGLGRVGSMEEVSISEERKRVEKRQAA